MALIRGVAAGAAVLLLLTGCRDRIESANEAAEVANAQLATTLPLPAAPPLGCTSNLPGEPREAECGGGAPRRG